MLWNKSALVGKPEILDAVRYLAATPPKINWAEPDYSQVLLRRARALQLLNENPGAKDPLFNFYRDNWAAFIIDWGWTYDPRKAAENSPTDLPFILFPKQVEFINWIYARFKAKERGMAEKTREVGFSWLSIWAGICVWLFYPNAAVGYGSRKKELVDNGDDDPDSLFWKIRWSINRLPPAFIPEDYGAGRKLYVVPNPENGAVIKGEIGDGIGRGGRSTIYFVDESDSLEHQQLVESSLAATTDCRIDISTAEQVGSLFYNMRRQLPSHQVFFIDWWEDPRKRLNPDRPKSEEPWYLKKKRELTSTTFSSQVERNPAGAVGNTYFDLDDVTRAKETSISRIVQPDSVPWRLGIDASGMGNDESILWRRQGRKSLPPIALGNLDGPQMAAKVLDHAATLLRAFPFSSIELVSIEQDGPGGSCADQLKYTWLGRVLRALHTGRRLNDGENYNVRAYLHRQAKDYLSDGVVHLPDDPIFFSQITSLLHEYKGGLLLMESKDDYRRRLSGLGGSKSKKYAGKSPDRSDAFVLTFAPPRGERVTVTDIEPGRGMLPSANGFSPLDSVFGY